MEPDEKPSTPSKPAGPKEVPMSESTQRKFDALIELCTDRYNRMISSPLEPFTVSQLTPIARSMYEFVSLFDSRPEFFYQAHTALLTRHLESLLSRLLEVHDPEALLRLYLDSWNFWLLSHRRIGATATHFVMSTTLIFRTRPL